MRTLPPLLHKAEAVFGAPGRDCFGPQPQALSQAQGHLTVSLVLVFLLDFWQRHPQCLLCAGWIVFLYSFF